MKKLDKEIRKMAKQTQCPVSREYEERMDSLLNNLTKESTTEQKSIRTFSLPKTAFAACVLGAVVLVSVPVAAKVSSMVTERMEAMSKNQQNEYADAQDSKNMTKAHETESVQYSRELSAEENTRYNEFLQKYEEGLFPEGELQMVDKLKENAEIAKPVYEVWNREIYLPERDLTDEELLEIIDFHQKSAYSVSHTAKAQEVIDAQQAFLANPNPGEDDLSEEEAIAKASAYLEAMCGMEAEKMGKTVEFVMGDDMENGKYGSYAVTFKGSDDKSYEVAVTRETGTLSHIWFYVGEGNCGSRTWLPVAVDEEICTSAYEKARNIIADMYPDANITGGTCGYTVDEDGNSKYGNLSFDVIINNNFVYNFTYAIEDDTFVSLFKTSYDEEQSSSPEDYVVKTME